MKTPLPEHVAPHGVRPHDSIIYEDTVGCTHVAEVYSVGEDGLEMSFHRKPYYVSYEVLLKTTDGGDRIHVEPAAGRVREGEVER